MVKKKRKKTVATCDDPAFDISPLKCPNRLAKKNGFIHVPNMAKKQGKGNSRRKVPGPN